MSQDLITANNPQPILSSGDLVFSGYYSGWQKTITQTIPAGSYYIRTSKQVLMEAPNSWGRGVITVRGGNSSPDQAILLLKDETNLTFSTYFDVWSSTRYIPSTLTVTGTSNIIYDGTNFMFATLNSGTTRTLFYSTDAITWSTRALPTNGLTFQGPTNRPQFLYASGATNKYILFYNSTDGTGACQYSTDGVTWSVTNYPTSTAGALMPSYNGNLTEKYCAKIFNSSTSQVITSTDGVTWTQRTFYSSDATFTLAGSGGTTGVVWILGSNNFTNNIGTSTDGITWTSRTTGITAGAITTAYAFNTWFVAYASNCFYYSTSTDGITWTNAMFTPGHGIPSSQVGSLVDGKMYFPSASTIGGGYVLTTDFVTWTNANGAGVAGATTSTLVYNGSKYVALNVNNIYISPDKTYIALYKVNNQPKVV